MKKILIVEDEHELLDFMKIRLEANKYEVIGACDGKEGYEKACNDKPDLILLDLMLPKIDGYWVCDLLKKDERHRDTPIIIITAKSGDANHELAKKCGADAYMQKPLDMGELLAKMSSLLK